MTTLATFQSTIDSPWTEMEPLRLGRVQAGLGTADRFVVIECDDIPYLRVDLYQDDESFPFEEIVVWSGFVAIGWGHHLHLLELKSKHVSSYNLDSYFGHLFPTQTNLLVASANQLFCFDQSGSLLWTSDTIGIDGVIVQSVSDQLIHGEGEWDPPGGWKPFTVNLLTGKCEHHDT